MPKLTDAKKVETEKGTDGWNGTEVDSVFRLVILASQRAKQLQRGAQPRVNVSSPKQRHTYTALEEVKQGKIRFVEIDGGDLRTKA